MGYNYNLKTMLRQFRGVRVMLKTNRKCTARIMSHCPIEYNTIYTIHSVRIIDNVFYIMLNQRYIAGDMWGQPIYPLSYFDILDKIDF